MAMAWDQPFSRFKKTSRRMREIHHFILPCFDRGIHAVFTLQISQHVTSNFTHVTYDLDRIGVFQTLA